MDTWARVPVAQLGHQRVLITRFTRGQFRGQPPDKWKAAVFHDQRRVSVLGSSLHGRHLVGTFGDSPERCHDQSDSKYRNSWTKVHSSSSPSYSFILSPDPFISQHHSIFIISDINSNIFLQTVFRLPISELFQSVQQLPDLVLSLFPNILAKCWSVQSAPSSLSVTSWQTLCSSSSWQNTSFIQRLQSSTAPGSLLHWQWSHTAVAVLVGIINW